MEDTILTKQFLTFSLEEQFAINVSHVLEVLEFSRITKLPNTPDFMSGVINNRGSMVPIISLRRKFKMSEIDQSQDTCFIIIEINVGEDTVNVGMLVDSVKEVINLDEDQIEPPPKIGMPLDTQYIKGLGKVEENFVIILDIEKILTTEEISMLKDTEKVEVEA